MTQLQLIFDRAPRVRRITVREHRTTKRQEIERLFTENAGVRFCSAEMHVRFGTSFRTRVSEINRSEAAIVIRNEVTHDDEGREASVYWAEFKH